MVGLYLEPPENSNGFWVDEKSQLRALKRTHPILPMREGIPERQTHDYYRHGTTTLFAALNVVSGNAAGTCKRSHKAENYASFLKLRDKKAPKEKVLHIIANRYSAHKAPPVRKYLDGKKERSVEHFIPVCSSWRNMIERWLAETTNKRIRRESWNSLAELETAITDYIISWNKTNCTCVWTKTFNEIQASIEKAKYDTA